MAVSTQNSEGIAFLAFPGQTELLLSELEERFGFDERPEQTFGELLLFADRKRFMEKSGGKFPYWSRTVMTAPFILNFDTIGEAAGALKKIMRNWAPYQFTQFRRAALIQEKLPYINLKPRKFPSRIPGSPIGLYTLTGKNTMLASAETTSRLPAGTVTFIEDHENPPSRAYLKIQESLTMAQLLNGTEFPHEGQKCLEAGACPGGWTWVLAGLGAEVLAVDRSELVPELMANPLVKFMAHDAFTIRPQDAGAFDWIFSDVICYPERLLGWINGWLDSGLAKNMICTIKMQGKTDWNLISRFEEIPGSRILHLNYNKHELTWIRTERTASDTE